MESKNRWWLALALPPIALAAYLLWWPVPIEPEAWEPPPAEPFRPTAALHGERVSLPEGHGPEDVDVDELGRVFVGTDDGRIWRFTGGEAEVLADTGGRPLGLDWAADGRLLVADARAGLLAVDPGTGALETLATTCGGTPLRFTDDVEAGPDGTIWFSDASSRFGIDQYELDLLENGPSGRLCALAPGDAEPREALAGLHFANGVAVDPGGRFVLVGETARYRVRRLWLTGPRAGEDEVFVDDLPGFNDGISTGQGRFWIAIASPRNPLVDRAGPLPWLREVMVRLPRALQPAPERTARAIAVDEDGRVLHDLFDPAGTDITTVSSVQERAGRLYLGSLTDTAWAWLPAP